MIDNDKYFRKEMIEQQPPPPSQAGLIGWLWKNLFSSMSNFSSFNNSIQSVFMILFTFWLAYYFGGLLYSLFNFAIFSAVWSDPEALKGGVCRTVLAKGVQPEGWYGACWPFIWAKKKFLIYGRIPYEEIWRVNIFYFVLVSGIVYTIWEGAPKRIWVGVAMLTIFPIFSLIILTGANFNISPNTFIFSGLSSVFLFILGFAANRRYLGEILKELSSLVYILSIFTALFFIIICLFSLDYGLTPIDTLEWGGLMLTLVVAITGIVASLPLGIVLALGRRSNMYVARLLCTIFIEFWRGIPLITVLFAASVLIPLFLPEGVDFNKLLRALVGIILFSSAYMAEVVRGGLQAIPRGQFEGASAVGLSYPQSMRLIVLPQALTHVIPGIVNTFIGLFKDTTLVIIIGLQEILGIARSATQDANWGSPVQHSTSYLVAALLFFIFCFGMSRYSVLMEKKLSRGNKD